MMGLVKELKIMACCVSMDVLNSIKTLELSKEYGHLVLPFIGIHPQMATRKSAIAAITVNEKDKDIPKYYPKENYHIHNLDKMKDMITENISKISGIGEIGLDKTFTDSSEEFIQQKFVFEELLGIAEKFSKPVSVHSRKTLDEVYEIIPSFDLGGKILLHWFDGSKKQLQKAMDLDCYISFGPVMVYANDKQVLLSKARQDRILVETDGPVKFSRCFEFKPAQPIFIPSVVFCASKILNMTYNETSKILENNSRHFLE